MIFENSDIQRIEKRLETLRGVPTTSEYLERLELLADLYLKQDSYEPAIEYIEEILAKALYIKMPKHKRLLLEMKAVECLLKRSRCAEALSRCSGVAAELATEPNGQLSAQLSLLVSHAYWKVGDYPKSVSACEEAVRHFSAQNDERGLAQCESLLGKSFLRLGQFARAKSHFEKALGSYLRLNDRNGIAVAHNNLGLLHKNHGEWQVACDHLTKALELDRESGNYGKTALRRLNLGLVYLRIGHWMKAKESVEEALSTAQRIGDRHTSAAASLALGNCMRLLGQPGTADRLYRQALSIARRNRLMRELALAHEFMGETDLAGGKVGQAMDKLDRALEIAEQIAPEGDIVAEVERRRAEAFLVLSDLKGARKACRRSLSLCALNGDRYEQGAALSVAGLLKAESGCIRSARVAFKASVRILEVVGDRYGLGRTLLRLGRLLASAAKTEKDKLEARRTLARAAGLFSELGAERLLIETERELEAAWSEKADETESRWPRCPERAPSGSIHGFVTQDPVLMQVLHSAGILCEADTPLLIQGETGTGKNLLAYVFRSSDEEKGRPFVELNCAAIPCELLESELFGYSRGAFSGATADKKGILEEAHGGTVFLNEIGEMDARMQAKLLHVLDDGCYRRVGETSVRRLVARIVSATNKDLWKEVQRGAFRRDLYFRLAQSTLTISPLRERRDDIALLSRHFFQVYSGQYSKEVSAGAPGLEVLCDYEWPGNVRELKNRIQMLVLDSPKRKVLSASDVERALGMLRETAEPRTLAGKLEQLKRAEISRAVASHGGNKTKAARALGMSRRGLCKVLERMRIEGGGE